MFRLHIRNEIPENYRSAYVADNIHIMFLLDHLFDNGFSMHARVHYPLLWKKAI